MPASDLHQVPTSRVCLAYKDQNSSLFDIGPPTLQHSRPADATFGSHCGFSDKFQQIQQHPRQQHYLEYRKNSIRPVFKPYSFQEKTSSTSTCHFNEKPKSWFFENGVFITSAPSNMAFVDIHQHPQHESGSAKQLFVSSRALLHNSYGRNHQKEPQQLCPYYPQGKCYYGNHCKFIHVSNRNYC